MLLESNLQYLTDHPLTLHRLLLLLPLLLKLLPQVRCPLLLLLLVSSSTLPG